VQDTNGNRITLGYTNGLPTTITHSSGAQLVLAYNAGGRLASVTDPLGRVTTYEYDASGEHLVRVTQPGGRVTAYTYDTGAVLPREHALLSVTYPDGTHSNFAYDDNGRLTQTSGDNGGEAVSYAYDTAGGVTVTDATGRVTHLAFGLAGQRAQVRDGQGRVVNFGYGSQMQLTQLLGPAGEKYSYTFDTRGNLTGVRDPRRQSTIFSYDPTFNQLTSFTDARGNGLVYTYDGHGNLTAITYPDGTSEQYTYDTQGDVLAAKNRRGQTVTYSYNAAGQVTSKDDSTTPGAGFTYGYDAAGNLTSATDASGTMMMSYDPATDLLTRIDYPGGHFFTFRYDAAGRRTQRTDQDGNVVTYAYDALGRLDHMTDGKGALIVHYEYDAAGRLSKNTLGNGVYTTYEYDAAGDVLHLVNFKPDSTILSRYDYTYDQSGRVTSMATLTGTQTYGYDPLGQVTSVTYSGGRVVTYAYDGAGNRTTVTDNGVATGYTTNALNQYTAVGGATYSYDADGNMTSKTENGVTTTYTYDAENRLVGVATPTDTWAYQYDAFGNRIGATHNGVAVSYVIDPTGLGNIAAEYNGSGRLIARYDDGYGLLGRTDAAGNAAYYTFSAIGNTSELTSAMGAVLNQYAYDPFGVSLGKTEAVVNPFQYVGEYSVVSEGSGLGFMRARYYEASLGRLLQPDPLRIDGGTNFYRYSSNNPVSLADPEGKDGYVIFPGKGPVTITFPDPLPPDPCEGEHLHGCYEIGHPERREQPDLPRLPRPKPSPTPQPEPSPEPQPSPVGTPVPAPHPTPTPEPSPTPIPPRSSIGTNIARTVYSYDPNDKLGPGGYGDAVYVPADQPLAYQVDFENQSTATAPAQQVVVTDTLDPNLDLNTFELSYITVANQSIAAPPALDHYEATFPVTANGNNILVNVRAALDRATRRLTLTLQAVDPATGTFPADPLVGLLYPNDATGRGVGSISYSARPLAGLPSGTVIQNRAQITFDYNDPIDTPLVHNTLDAGTPTSSVAPLSAVTNRPTLTVRWSGQDETGGAGIAGYDLYASEDGGPYSAVLTGTTSTSATLTVAPGHAYAFYSIATDNAGHRQPAPTHDQAATLVDVLPPTSTVAPLPPFSPAGFTVTWSGSDGAAGSGVASYDVFVSDNGGPFTAWQTATTHTSAPFTGQDGHTYAFYSVATDKAGNRQRTPTTAQAQTTQGQPPPAPPPVPPAARGITAQLVTVKHGKKKRLVVRVFFADTGAKDKEFTSPYQAPAFKGIQLSLRDTNGDGVPDTVVLTARKGKKTVTSLIPG
jgi:RHS repeat-associated protein/uncharacterized repeat protein (TIGR01451 family)